MLKEEFKPSQEFQNSILQSIEESIPPDASPVEKGNQFLKWIVKKLFDVSDDDFQLHHTDKGHDHGIDFWMPDPSEEEGGFIQIFQMKYGKSHKDGEIKNFQHKVEEFFKMDPNKIERDELKDIISEKIENNLEPELIYITNNEVSEPEKYLPVKVYGIRQIVEKLWDDIFGKPRGQISILPFESFCEYDHSILGVVSLQNFRKFVGANKSYIFESNVRKYLGEKKRGVNQLLQKTIDEFPEDFFKYNNGITIVVTKFEKQNNTEIKLTEAQIVNGAQTASTILNKVKPFDVRKGSVSVTIIQEDVQLERNKITRYRNSQNAIQGKDLISLERDHQDVHAQLKAMGYYYEYQAGGWIGISESERKTFEGNPSYDMYLKEDEKPVMHVIEVKDAIQAMVAGIWQEPTKPYGSVGRYMPGGTQYKHVFKVDFKAKWQLFFYPYLVLKYCVNNFKYGKKAAELPELKYARLLFVTAYFLILSKYVMKKDIEKIKEDPTLLENYFKNFEANSMLLKFTHERIKNYVGNARDWIEEKPPEDKPTLHNFFSRSAWDEQLQRSFKNHVEVNKPKLQEIINKFKNEA